MLVVDISLTDRYRRASHADPKAPPDLLPSRQFAVRSSLLLLFLFRKAILLAPPQTPDHSGPKGKGSSIRIGCCPRCLWRTDRCIASSICASADGSERQPRLAIAIDEHKRHGAFAFA